MKDEFSKLAYIYHAYFGGKGRLKLFFTNLKTAFYKYVWYKYIFSNIQALHMPFICSRDTVNSCLVLPLCEIHFSENETNVHFI